MSVRLRKWKDREGRVQEAWVVDVKLEHPDGRIERVRKASPVNTRRGAEAYERELRGHLLDGTFRKEQEKTGTVPTVRQFMERFLVDAENNNKPSTFDAKKVILTRHILPELGE